LNGLLVSRGVDVPTVESRDGRGRDGRGADEPPGENTVPPEVRMRDSVDVSGRGAGVVGAGNPNDVSTGFAPGLDGFGVATGTQVSIGSVPARK
jgi:hypothetical protein